ncbi:MAG TPA: erythromycin esterase family protein [Caulobacteraceae bacterium]|nr:erythromycin esterase family protein [Caulobacteraceae bacterium]
MLTYPPLFADRAEAGRRLGELLATREIRDPVIYALPRGGVPVAVEIARALAAPVELLLVRKIGAPGAPELALAAVVDGGEAQTVVNEDVRRLTSATPAFLEAARRKELEEIERRRSIYLEGRPRLSAKGRTAIVVDDGLATGATAKAALRALRREGAAKVVLAVPVAPTDTLAEMHGEADEVICLEPSAEFTGVGAFYGDFHQLSDRETLQLLRGLRSPPPAEHEVARSTVAIPPLALAADLQVPADAKGVVLFAHGSGSSRLSPRNRAVADSLNVRGFATVLLDLLTDDEARDRRNVFDIGLLAERLGQAAAWIDLHEALGRLPLGLFGASTGAAAALTAAAELGERAGAVVSRGGRPDLAGPVLPRVQAPTLLIVGAEDDGVIDLNRAALAQLRCEKQLVLVPRATHLFEEPGALEEVMRLAGDWFDAHLRPQAPRAAARAATRALTPAARLRAAAEPLPPPEDPGFAAAFDRFADCRVVLLGEASHGTSEFYRARAAITRRLIERHGFSLVAVEADWPDAAAVDRHVREKPHRPMDARPFTRFPTWMWRNREFEAFVRWLRGHNAGQPPERRAAFYGLDLYNMRASMAAVLDYLGKVDPAAAAEARARYACLTPWSAEPSAYGMASLRRGYALCEGAVVGILRDMLKKALDYAAHDGEGFFDAEQNARLVADAERYYRAMYYGSHESWNLRDQHMFDTLERALAARGPDAKAVVWAHNSHIGDARFTEMGAERGELNLGQLCRERFGREAALIGFGTHTGAVMAADDWDEPGRVMQVRPSRSDSYEALCHQADIGRFLLDLRPGAHEAVRSDLREPRLERYIGVVYRPSTELVSHYARSCLPEQFDGFVWFDTTCAVEPLPATATEAEDETYPFGL